MDVMWLINLESNLSTERKVLVNFLKQLCEVDDKKLYAEKSYPSLFAFCTQELGLAESCAYKRIRTARLSKKFPIILEMIASGEIHMSSVTLLGPVMTDENYQNLLSESKGRSKREVELLVAKSMPKPDVPDSIRKLPEKQSTLPGESYGSKESVYPQNTERDTVESVPLLHSVDKLISMPREILKPLSEERYQIKFTGSKELSDKIEKIKQLLSHKFPEGKLEDLVNEILDFYLEKNNPEKKKVVNIKSFATKHTRYIPQNIKNLVWQRDEGRCTYVSEDGKRCEAKYFLELDHKKEFSRGGSSINPSNMQLLCRTHNQLRAEKSFGKRFMEKKIFLEKI